MVHLYYRHVYCAQSETEALYFLKTHNVTHLMLTHTDIIAMAGKVSYVGSDILFDRHFNLHPLLYMPTAPEHNMHSHHSTHMPPLQQTQR